MLDKWAKKQSNRMPAQSLIPAAISIGVAGSSAYGIRKNSNPMLVVDQGLIWATVSLLVLGLIMVYSATVALPDSNKYANYQSTHFLLRHAVSIVVAFVAAFLKESTFNLYL